MGSSPLTETIVPDETAATGPTLLAAGTEVAVRYEVRSVLGSGGSAVVYEAHDRELGLDVALKVLRADRLTPAALRRFRREVAVTRRIASPRLVRVFDLGEADGLLYLTMELVRGQSLAQRLRRERLGVEVAVRIATEVLEGLAALHAQGVVHRDVKPGNILLDGAGSARLADFGLAREVVAGEGRVTESEALVGTLHYLSPEQALGQELDLRSDLYSFGLVLYEMLAGRLAFERPSAVGALLARLTDRPADLRTARPELPRWLVETVESLLARDRARRPASATEALAALRRRRAPSSRRLGKSARLAAWALAGVAGLSSVAAAGRVLLATRFARLEADGAVGVRAVDRAGRVLWARRDIASTQHAAVARLGTRSPSIVAVASSTPSTRDPVESHRLLFLDPQSGRVTRTEVLPGGARLFPGYADRYVVSPLLAVDLDADGRDEVVATYVHDPYWPSYTVLLEPSTRRSAVVFAGSGHHRAIGAADVDGDGRREIVLVGTNNLMGWYGAVAAVKAPPIAADGVGGSLAQLAESPDDDRFVPRQETLAWYALCPPVAARVSDLDIRVDEPSRTVHIPFVDPDVPPIVMGFGGFIRAKGVFRPESDRQRDRRAAYAKLRAARRAAAGFSRQAPELALQAVESARRAEDPVLIEWASRVQALCLVRAGATADADRVLEALLQGPVAPSGEICFQTAHDRHLTGRLDEAVNWYRRGLAEGAERTGRSRGELLEGLVLALVEEGRYDDARRDIDAFRRAYSAEVSPTGGVDESVRCGEYVTFRQTGRVSARPFSQGDDSTDLRRHWILEFEASAGGDAHALLERVRAEKAYVSGSPGLLLSLESKLLADLGKSGEALEAGRRAFEEALRASASDVATRGMLNLVAERLADLLRRGGFAEEARRARERAAAALGPARLPSEERPATRQPAPPLG